MSIGAGPANLAWHVYFDDKSHYKNAKDLTFALCPIFNKEMKELVKAGANYFQIEDLGAWLPLFSGDKKDDYAWVRESIERMTDGVDAKIGWHFCFGNAWGNDILSANFPQGYQTVLPHFFGTAGVDEFVLDYANRHMDGVDFLKNLPANQGIQLGVLDIRTNAIEAADQHRRAHPPRAEAHPGRQGHAEQRLRHEAAVAHGGQDEAGRAGRGREHRSQGNRRLGHPSPLFNRGNNGMAKVIAVLGSTGGQGGGLCRAILADPGGGFSCRAITRDPSKDKAKALAAAGAEVVAADLDDVESLKKAFAGAHGVFAVTNFWEHFSAEKEKTAGQERRRRGQGRRRQARGVVHAGRHPAVDEVGRHAHADAAGQLPRAALRRQGRSQRVLRGRADHVPADDVLLGQPVHVRAGAEEGRRRQVRLGLPARQRQDGGHRRRGHRQVRLRHPQGRRPVRRQDRGHHGRSADRRGDGPEAREAGLGIGPVIYNAVDANTYRSWGFPGADEMGNMFQVYRDFEGPFLANRSVATAKQLNPQLQDFSTWLAANKSKVPV